MNNVALTHTGTSIGAHPSAHPTILRPDTAGLTPTSARIERTISASHRRDSAVSVILIFICPRPLRTGCGVSDPLVRGRPTTKPEYRRITATHPAAHR